MYWKVVKVAHLFNEIVFLLWTFLIDNCNPMAAAIDHKQSVKCCLPVYEIVISFYGRSLLISATNMAVAIDHK